MESDGVLASVLDANVLGTAVKEARQPDFIIAEDQSRVTDTRIASSSGARHMLNRYERQNEHSYTISSVSLPQAAARKSHRGSRQLPQWAIPTGHRQGEKRAATSTSRQYLLLTAPFAGEPPSLLPRGQADAVASVAPAAVEQPVGATHGRKQG